MKPMSSHSRMLACALSLTLVPLALAGGDKDKKFSKMDADGDGRISRMEHMAGAQQMFAEMDANRDGFVTAAEMESKGMKHGEHERGEMSASEKIREIDQNSDGRLTSVEHVNGAEKMFAKMDKDGDGYLSKEEMKAGHKMKMKKKSDS
jgi:Ca2+-binding protein (EF-Hand superfamily)